ncbi:MAG: (2Fe-2S) ferredoxin domain-containing protein [bacterium]|nr:(2Fe-2S) ferredoxin domain-containing protein [bacterium]
MKLEDLKKIREKMEKSTNLREGKGRIKAVVGMGTCGIAAGARDVLSALMDEISKRNLSDIVVTQSGCRGLCDVEPIIDVYEEGKQMVTYGNLTPEKTRRIVAEHFVNGSTVTELVISSK